jgi:hypothetical protein
MFQNLFQMPLGLDIPSGLPEQAPYMPTPQDYGRNEPGGLRQLFFGDHQFGGFNQENSELARMLMFSSLAQGLLGSINNNVPGGIDMSALGGGFANAAQGLAGLKGRQTQQEMSMAQMEASQANIDTDNLRQGAKNDYGINQDSETLRTAGDILRLQDPNAVDPTSVTHANTIISAAHRADPRERAEKVLRPVTQDGVHGYEIMTPEGEIQFREGTPGSTPYHAPSQTPRRPENQLTANQYINEFDQRVRMRIADAKAKEKARDPQERYFDPQAVSEVDVRRQVATEVLEEMKREGIEGPQGVLEYYLQEMEKQDNPTDPEPPNPQDPGQVVLGADIAQSIINSIEDPKAKASAQARFYQITNPAEMKLFITQLKSY